jgi:hypothetical protein
LYWPCFVTPTCMGANVSRSRDNTPRNSEVASPEPPAPASAPKKAKKDRKKEAVVRRRLQASRHSLFDKRDEGSRRRRALGVYKRETAQEHGDHLGPCYCRISKIRRPGAQTGECPSSRFQ